MQEVVMLVLVECAQIVIVDDGNALLRVRGSCWLMEVRLVLLLFW